jgi:hypothetical protein
MTKGWYRESKRHSLASRGIRTAVKENIEARVKVMKPVDSYWGDKWKIGTRIKVTDGDWTIGDGEIVGFSDEEKLWAIVKLDETPKDYRGYQYTKEGKEGYVSAYKGYSYRFTD